VPTPLNHATSWRRPFALFLGIALAAMLIVVAHPASAGALTIRSAKATTPGSSTQIEVSAASDSGITKITARLRLYGKDPFGTVEDFELVSGTATDGIWRTSQPVSLETAIVYVDVDATDASGATLTRNSAGSIDRRAKARFTEFTASPSSVDIDHDTVTYAGRLVYEDKDGSEHGIPGASLCLALEGNCISEGTTDSNGRFSSPVRLGLGPNSTYAVQRNAVALYYGSAHYGLATSPWGHLWLRPQQTRLSIGFSSQPKVIGDSVRVTGRLEREIAAGRWAGLPDQHLDIYTYDSDTQKNTLVATARTGSDGSYSKSVVVPQATQWSVSFPVRRTSDGGFEIGPYAPTDKGVDRVIVSQYRTSISRFALSPNPVGKGTQITASALLTKRTATGAALPVKTGYVDLQFSKDKKHWSWAGQSTPGANGQLKVRATAVSSGYWRLVYDGWDHRNLESVSATAHATVKYRTAISSLNAKPEPVRKGKTITVSGVLKRYTSAWHPLKAKVNIYFRAHGSKTWSYVGAAGADSHGKWHKGFKARKDGSWMAKYQGTSVYLPATSAQDYVDVR